MIRTLSGVVARIKALSLYDPSPDAREAYKTVLWMLSGVDDVDLERLIEATKEVK